MSEWDKCMSYSSSSALVFQKSLTSFNLGFRTFYLLRDNYLLYFISFFCFFSLFHRYCTDVSACIQCICGIRVCEPFLILFLFLNALTERSFEHSVYVRVFVCVSVCARVCVFSPCPFCLWSYPVYQHMFTELQEHARARFMKNNRYQD